MKNQEEKIAECKAAHAKAPQYTDDRRRVAMIVRTKLYGKTRYTKELGVNYWPLGVQAGATRINSDGSTSEVVCPLY